MQTVVDLARLPLNDNDPDDAQRRAPDADLLKYAIHGLLHTYRNRFDLWIGLTAPTTALALGDPFPLPDWCIEPLADYVTARAESVDDEFVAGNRAAAFYAMFGNSVAP